MSLIKRNKKTCKTCGEEKYIFSKGKCEYCAKKQYAPLKNKGRKKETVERKQYFETLIEKCRVSEESGVFIYNPSRFNICHIFPKRIYKSVEANENNFVFLTIDEHKRFDYLLDTMDFAKLEHEFKNSWKKVCTRIKLLLPLVEETGKLKYNLEKYIENGKDFNNNINSVHPISESAD